MFSKTEHGTKYFSGRVMFPTCNPFSAVHFHI